MYFQRTHFILRRESAGAHRLEKRGFVIILSHKVVAMTVAIFMSSQTNEIGVWTKAGPPAQVNVGCVQIWQCLPKKDILHGAESHLVATDNTSTIGVCSAAGGAIDSCNSCVAAEPAAPCIWHLSE
jgi:hypothetical protein